MRENKNLTIIMGSIALFSIVIAIFLNYQTFISETVENLIDIEFIQEIIIIIFEGSFFTALASLVIYSVNKRKILRKQGDLLVKLLNTINHYIIYSNNSNDIVIKNLELLDEIHAIVYGELSVNRREYCPFFKKSKQNDFIFSPLQYFYDFFDSINDAKDTLKAFQKIGYDNQLAQNYIKKIDDYFYSAKITYNEQNEISAISYDELMYKKLSSYINEYFDVVNKKHKGKYNSMNNNH